MTEPAYLRIPLSEAEAHRAELAATKAALAEALARIADLEDDAHWRYHGSARDSVGGFSAGYCTLKDALVDVCGQLLAGAPRSAPWSPWNRKTLEAVVDGRRIKLDADGFVYAVPWPLLPPDDEARASIAIDEGDDAVRTVTDPPPTKKPTPSAKPVDTRPHIATRRDAHGRRFWNGTDWTKHGIFALARTLAEWAPGKPRGSRLVALDDVPALLAEDAAKDAAKASTPVVA